MEKEASLLKDQSPEDFVSMEHYSGPLDLLLELIRQQKMDIFKIDIYKITQKYTDYLKQIPSPDLEKAGDFIRWASTLLYIKSKSLLPKEKEEEEELSAEKLKSKLSRLLVNYQKFQKAGEMLYSRNLLGRDCWKRTKSLLLEKPKEEKIELDKEKGLLQLAQSYHHCRQKQKAKEKYKIFKPIPSLLHRLKQIAEVLTIGSRLKFQQLSLIHKEKYSRLLSFLSILELSRSGFIQLIQKQLFSNIEIFVKKTVTEENLQRISSEEAVFISNELKKESLT